MKLNITPEELCKTLPTEFLELLKCARALSFTEKPDYARIHSLFHGLQVRSNGNGAQFDWQAPNFGQPLIASVIPCKPPQAANDKYLEKENVVLLKTPKRYRFN